MKGLGKEYFKKQKYTDEQLLEFLLQFEKEHRMPPTVADFINDRKYPSPNVYATRFGSWNRALEKAGLNINTGKGGTLLYADDELLESIKLFYKENGRPPNEDDFKNNPKYPNFMTYHKRFGSWSQALKLVGLDVGSMVRKGVVETTQQKGRLFELYVLEHFIERPIDLSGDNCNSPLDGKCPEGQTYDAKSTALVYGHWQFRLASLYRKDIEWFYLGAFSKDYKKLLHVWRIPGNFIDGDYIKIGICSNYRYNIENMEEFEITDKFKDIDISKI